MEDFPKANGNGIGRRLETDARAIVPIQDEVGGTAIYFSGRLAYYVLNGEWIQAVSGPDDSETGEIGRGVNDREAFWPWTHASCQSGLCRLPNELSRILGGYE